MPLYEYQCTECGARVEVLQRLSDPPLESCSTCGGIVTKLLSAPAFQFKGSGWYATDYAGKKDASSNGGSSPSADGKADTDKTKPAEGAAKETKKSEPKSKEKAVSTGKSDTS